MSRFLTKRIAVGALIMGAFGAVSGCSTNSVADVSIVDQPDMSKRNVFYVSNREPLAPSVLIKLPVGSIKPHGWLDAYLQRQRDGLTGNLGEISAWLQRPDNAWLASDGKGKWGWEELPYWLRGYGNIGYILNDPKMIETAKFWIEGTINSQRENGDFGPDHRMSDGSRDYWANMLMIYALQSWYEHSGDKRVLTLATRYYHYLNTVPDNAFLTGYWQRMRGGDMLYGVFWLYNHTGDRKLLELARKIHRRTSNWSQKNALPDWHNVNIAQGFREPATYYLLSKDSKDLAQSYENLELTRAMFGQVPGGMWGGDEISRINHTDPHQAIETCAVVEQLFSNEMMLWITGDPFWADHAEEVAFNTAPATSTPEFRSLRYLTAPNQIVSDASNHAPGINNDGPFFLMSALSSRCCQHNHSMGWPYYSENLWMATPDNGVAAMLYAANTAKVKVGDGSQVVLDMQGNYPFEEKVRIKLGMKKANEFPLYLRVPAWAKGAKLTVNGHPLSTDDAAGKYIRLTREWHDQDIVELTLPMELSVKRWVANNDAASVQYGPLTMSLKIKERLVERNAKETAIWDSQWQESVDLNKWKATEIFPASPWNYGLVYDPKNIAASFKVVRRPWPKNNFPFTLQDVPLVIEARGRRIPEWVIDKHGLAGELQDSPAVSNEPEEMIELVPMGAARLRISAMPVIGTGPTATRWRVKKSG